MRASSGRWRCLPEPVAAPVALAVEVGGGGGVKVASALDVGGDGDRAERDAAQHAQQKQRTGEAGQLASRATSTRATS